MRASDATLLPKKAERSSPSSRRSSVPPTARSRQGNSSQISDGAAALLLMTRDKAKALGYKPKARFRSWAVAGVDPTIMLTGPIPATKKVLQKAGLSLSNIDLFECNEAFASVPMAWGRELDVPWERVNVNGGAIALGHPLGATGRFSSRKFSMN
jgi:acetyl-CoA acyltransferase